MRKSCINTAKAETLLGRQFIMQVRTRRLRHMLHGAVTRLARRVLSMQQGREDGHERFASPTLRRKTPI